MRPAGRDEDPRPPTRAWGNCLRERERVSIGTLPREGDPLELTPTRAIGRHLPTRPVDGINPTPVKSRGGVSSYRHGCMLPPEGAGRPQVTQLSPVSQPRKDGGSRKRAPTLFFSPLLRPLLSCQLRGTFAPRRSRYPSAYRTPPDRESVRWLDPVRLTRPETGSHADE